MKWYNKTLSIRTTGKGMKLITQAVQACIDRWGIEEGMCFLFIPHTSASLVLSESYDPTAQQDVEMFLDKIAPEGESWHAHTLEGADDSPSHLRAAITATSECIPIDNGRLSLGTWQGIFLFEHRQRGHLRKVLIRCMDSSE